MIKPNIKPKQKRYKEIQFRLDDENNTRKPVLVNQERYEEFKLLIAKHYNLGVSPFFRQVIDQTIKQLNS